MGSSHTQLVHSTRGEFTWAFHDSEEIETKMLARIAKVRPHASLANRTPQEFTGAGAALPPEPPRREEQNQKSTLELAL